MSIDSINNRIKNEICYETINKLKDDNLLNDYKKCKSVQNEIDKLTSILEKHHIEDDKKTLIVNDYLIELVPPGTKGVIRGNKFNSIVKETVENLKLDSDRFEVCFEKHCDECITSEKPDWYILEKSTKKVIICMNQIDLWSGGQQLNRGYKYIFDNKINTNKSKLLCVVCNYIHFSTNKSKPFKLFKHGYANNTLCYIKNIESIINDFFK
jgi:hypothetical protein